MKLELNALAVRMAGIAAIAGTAAAMANAADQRAERQGRVAAADGTPLQGRLELVWGDGRPGPNRTSKLFATLIDDDGRAHPLDAVSAKRAAGDLRRLDNRRVAIALSSSRSANADGLLTPEVIVPIDDLTAGGGSASKAGDISTLAAVSGQTSWVTVMCKFKDVAAEPKPKSYFTNMYANTSGRLDHYWRQVSHGKMNLAGSAAFGWYTLPQPLSYYKNPSNGYLKLQLIQDDCLAAANPSVDYTGYYGINMVFNQDVDGYAYGDLKSITLDGATRRWGITWNAPWAYMYLPNANSGISTLTHEMGHAYDLSHSDNTDGDDDTYDNPWDLMSGGWTETALDSNYGLLPQHPIGHQRDQLGWVAAARLRKHLYTTPTTTYTLDRASFQASTNVLLIKLMVPGGSDYYTVEARKKSGGIYESELPGDAVIIHAVRGGYASIVDARTPPHTYSNQESNMFKAGESWTTPEPAGKRFKIEVLAATQSGFTVRVSSL
ncbi:MAG: hypothetical protein E6Q50_03750 [Lysobacter sp.]|nr:MAG: hypothetical protein E6Q50_03750 [Lysobacter sp.]